MTANVGDWVGELTTTTGTGDIALGGQLVGHAPFSSIGNGEVWYAIVDGLNREAGLGILTGNTLQRTTVYSTLVDGVFSDAGYPIALSGKADVYCTFNKAAYDQIIDAFNKIIEGDPGFQEAFEVPFAPGDGIEATDVQAAIDEVNSDVLSNDDDILDLQNNKLDASAAVTEINDLSDVDTTGKSEGRVLQFDASGNLIVGDSFDEVLNQAMTKADFYALAEKRIRDSNGSGDSESMAFEDFYETPVTTANEITLLQRNRVINGVSFNVAQVTLTLPDASDSEAVLSNQTLISFDAGFISVSDTDLFYEKGDLSSSPISWASLSDAQKVAYIQDFENNIYSDSGKLYQSIYQYIITDLQQDYDKDGIDAMIAAGYVYDVDSTFARWTKADTIAVPIALAQRRNQGAYHPVYNPNGTANFGDGNPWYSTTDASDSTLDCFTSVGDGSISGADSGRSDSKYYDAIYASDVSDLRMSSRRVPLAQIREGYKRKAIAGEVRGFEGVPFSIATPDGTLGSGTSPTASRQVNIDPDSYEGNYQRARLYLEVSTSQLEIGDFVQVLNVTTGQYFYGYSYVMTGDTVFIAMTKKNFTPVSENWTGDEVKLVIEKENLHSQANPTWTDIIGDPANIAATFPDGVEGRWVPEIPDGTTKDYLLNRKSLASSTDMESTGDNGVSWAASSIAVDTTTNTINIGATGVSVQLHHYETQAHFTEDDANSAVLDFGDVWGFDEPKAALGNVLQSSLIEKVATTSAGFRWKGVPLTTTTIDPRTGMPVNSRPLEHESISLDWDNDSPAVKTLDYLSSENGVGKLVYAYKEMVYDESQSEPQDFTLVDGSSSNAYLAGTTYSITSLPASTVLRCVANYSGVITSLFLFNGKYQNAIGTVYFEVWNGTGWGDNNQFEIIDNQSTLTDDNGNTVLYGTASFNTQYFIDYSDTPLEISHYSDGEEDE